MAENLSVSTEFSGYFQTMWNLNEIYDMVGYKVKFSLSLMMLCVIVDKYG
jgi:uncharacterized protein YfkK (UPF0435 family)